MTHLLEAPQHDHLALARGNRLLDVSTQLLDASGDVIVAAIEAS